LTPTTTMAEEGVVEAGSNKEKITIQIPGEQQAREQVQARRRIRNIDDNDDNDDNIAIPNSLAGNRNDAAPKYIGHVPNYPRSCNTFMFSTQRWRGRVDARFGNIRTC
jgi:hypothetical protein